MLLAELVICKRVFAFRTNLQRLVTCAHKSCFIYTETLFIRIISRERTCPDKRGFTVIENQQK